MQNYKFSFKGQNIYVGIDARSEGQILWFLCEKINHLCPRDLPEAADFRFSILVFGEQINHSDQRDRPMIARAERITQPVHQIRVFSISFYSHFILFAKLSQK